MLSGVGRLEFLGTRLDQGASRIAAMEADFGVSAGRLDQLCDLAAHGLKQMVLPDLGLVHTMRSKANRDGSGTNQEGDNLRYAVNVAQGLNWTSDATQ